MVVGGIWYEKYKNSVGVAFKPPLLCSEWIGITWPDGERYGYLKSTVRITKPKPEKQWSDERYRLLAMATQEEWAEWLNDARIPSSSRFQLERTGILPLTDKKRKTTNEPLGSDW